MIEKVIGSLQFRFVRWNFCVPTHSPEPDPRRDGRAEATGDRGEAVKGKMGRLASLVRGARKGPFMYDVHIFWELQMTPLRLSDILYFEQLDSGHCHANYHYDHLLSASPLSPKSVRHK